MTRIFTGDYSTGDLLQWDGVHNCITADVLSKYPGGYPVQVVSLGDCGFAARFEVRDGDIALGSERSEVAHPVAVRPPAGSTRWYAWSIMFDPTFPVGNEGLWGTTNQFRSNDVGSFATLQWGFQDTADSWSLIHNPQSAPLVRTGDSVRLLDLPIDRGAWHDITMRVVWSASDATGSTQVWYDGVRQTFSVAAGGGDTFLGRTLIPGDTEVNYKEGLYRSSDCVVTGIVWHANFRMADSESSL